MNCKYMNRKPYICVALLINRRKSLPYSGHSDSSPPEGINNTFKPTNIKISFQQNLCLFKTKNRLLNFCLQIYESNRRFKFSYKTVSKEFSFFMSNNKRPRYLKLHYIHPTTLQARGPIHTV